MPDSLLDLVNSMRPPAPAAGGSSSPANTDGGVNSGQSQPSSSQSFSGPAVDQSAPSMAASAVPAASPRLKGDDLLAQAWTFSQLTPDEKASARLFSQSKNITLTQMQSDPVYAEKFLSGAAKLKGAALTDYVVNEGDKLKIAQLQRTEPNLFNSEEAAKAGFINSATFNQLSRLMGVVGKVVQGRDAAEVTEEQAEKLRLLKVAYPNASWTGEVASYLMPGSPAKYAFEKAAGIGAGTVAKLLGRVTANPGLLGKIAEAAGAGGAGGAAIGAVEGTAGSGSQKISLDRGLETSLAQGAAGATTAGVMSGVAGAFAPKSVLGKLEKGITATLQQSTGTSIEAMRAYNANPDAIKAASGTQADIGRQLSDFLLDKNASRLPERIEADNLLDRFPAVNARKTIDFLKGQQKTNNPEFDGAIKTLNEMGNRFELQLSDPNATHVPAAQMRSMVDELQLAAKGEYGTYSDFIGSKLKQAAAISRQSIVDTSNGMQRMSLAPGADDATIELGNVGKTYNSLMQKTAEKRDILGFMTKQLGGSPDAIQKNSEKFINNIFGANKDVVQSRLSALDDKFGTNFMELAQNASYAKQLGPDGVPQSLPTHRTGATTLGATFGGAAGGLLGYGAGALLGHAGTEIAGGMAGGSAGKALGEAAGSALSSPKVATSLIGMSDKITKFADVMTSNPQVLQRIASSGSEYPNVVKGIASKLLNTLNEDGPMSASSSLRLVADTPYFVGLVHAFDLTQQKQDSKTRYNAVSKVQGANGR